MNAKTKKIALLGMFCALSVAISYIETLIPPLVPVPGVKPGFSNIVTMFATVSLGFPYGLAVAVFKAMFALITRGVTAFFMSLCGGLLSLVMMWILFRFTKTSIGYIGIGVLSAISHNMGQLAVAVLKFFVQLLQAVTLFLGDVGGLLLSFLGGGNDQAVSDILVFLLALDDLGAVLIADAGNEIVFRGKSGNSHAQAQHQNNQQTDKFLHNTISSTTCCDRRMIIRREQALRNAEAVPRQLRLNVFQSFPLPCPAPASGCHSCGNPNPAGGSGFPSASAAQGALS